MPNPYDPLSINEQNIHYANNLAGYTSLYPSGEAHFFDIAQTTGVADLISTGNNSAITNATSGIFDRDGLLSSFSSGPKSRNYAITDFKTFNPYRHYITAGPALNASDGAYKINISGLLQKSTYNFNIYSTSFRSMSSNEGPK